MNESHRFNRFNELIFLNPRRHGGAEHKPQHILGLLKRRRFRFRSRSRGIVLEKASRCGFALTRARERREGLQTVEPQRAVEERVGSGGREGAEVVGEGKEEGTEDVTGRRELREGEEGNEDGIVESTENKSRPACLRE